MSDDDDMVEAADGAIYFMQPGPTSTTALLTCRPKDVELSADDLEALGVAMLRAAAVLRRRTP